MDEQRAAEEADVSASGTWAHRQHRGTAREVEAAILEMVAAGWEPVLQSSSHALSSVLVTSVTYRRAAPVPGGRRGSEVVIGGHPLVVEEEVLTLTLPRLVGGREIAEGIADACGEVAGRHVLVSWREVSSAPEGWGSMLGGMLRRRGGVVSHTHCSRSEWLGERPAG